MLQLIHVAMKSLLHIRRLHERKAVNSLLENVRDLVHWAQGFHKLINQGIVVLLRGLHVCNRVREIGSLILGDGDFSVVMRSKDSDIAEHDGADLRAVILHGRVLIW